MNKKMLIGFCIFGFVLLFMPSLIFSLNTNIKHYSCDFYDEINSVNYEPENPINGTNETLKINSSWFEDGNYSFNCRIIDGAGNIREIRDKYYIKDSVNASVSYQLKRNGSFYDFDLDYDYLTQDLENSPKENTFYFSPNDILKVIVNDEPNGNFSSGIINITYGSGSQTFFNNLKPITSINPSYSNFDKRKQYTFEIPLINITESTTETQNYNFSLNITDYSLNSQLENFTFILDNETPKYEFINITCEDGTKHFNDTKEFDFSKIEVSCDKVKFYFNISNEKDIDTDSITINSDVGVLDSRFNPSFNSTSNILMIPVDLNDVLMGNYRNFTLKAQIFDYAGNMNETNFSFSVDKKAPEINIIDVTAGTSLFLNGRHHIFYSSNHFNISFNLSEEANCTLNTDSRSGNFVDTETSDNISHTIKEVNTNNKEKYKPLVCQDMVGNSFSLNFEFNPDVNPPTIDNFQINAIKSPRTEFVEIISSNGNEKLGSFSFKTVDSNNGGNDYASCVYYGNKTSGYGNMSLNFSIADNNPLFTEDYTISHDYEFTNLLMNLSNITTWSSDKISGNYIIKINCSDASGRELHEGIKDVNFTVNLNEFDIIKVEPISDEFFYSKDDELKIDVFFNKNESITCNLTNSSEDIVSRGQFEFEDQNSKAFVFYNLSEEGEHNLTVSCKKLEFDSPSQINLSYTLDLSAPSINIINLTQLNYSNLTSGYNDHNSINYNEEEFLIFHTSNISINMSFNDTYTDFINLTMVLDGYTPVPNSTNNKIHNYIYNETVSMDGIYTFRVIANDGHHSNTTTFFVLVDTKYPVINEDSVTNKTYTNHDYNLEFSIENETDETLNRVWVSINNYNYSSDCTYDSTHYVFNCNTFLNLSNELNNVTIHVEDYVGNSVNFSFNTTKDSGVAKPSFSGIQVIDGTYIKESENNYTISKDTVRLNITIDSSENYKKIKTKLGTSSSNHNFDEHASWNWSNPIDLGCSDGQTKTLELKVTDIYGNTNSTFINFTCDFIAPSLELKTKTTKTKTGKFDFGIFTNEDFDRAELTVYNSEDDKVTSLDETYNSNDLNENTLIHTSRLNKSTKYSDDYIVVNGNITDDVSNDNYVSFNYANEIKYVKIKSLDVEQKAPFTYITKVYLDDDNIVRDKYSVGKEIDFYDEEHPNNMIYVKDFDINETYVDGTYYFYVVAYDELNNTVNESFNVEKDSNLQLEIDVKSPIYDTYSDTDEGIFEGYLLGAREFEENPQINIVINVTPEFNAVCTLKHNEDDELGLEFEEVFERKPDNVYELVIGQDHCVIYDTFNESKDDNNYLCKLGGGFIKTTFEIECIDEDMDSSNNYTMNYSIMAKDWNDNDLTNWCSNEINENYYGDYCSAAGISGQVFGIFDNTLNISLENSEFSKTTSIEDDNQFSLFPIPEGKTYYFNLTNLSYFINKIDGLDNLKHKITTIEDEIHEVNISIGRYAHLNINATNPSNFTIRINSSNEGYDETYSIADNLPLKLKPSNYTLTAYQYGFVENTTIIELNESDIKNISFNLIEKPKVNISGVAYLNDSETHENITIIAVPIDFDRTYLNETNSTGHFKINDLYNKTDYNLTFEKKYGYYSNSTLITTPNNSINVTLYPIPLTNLTGCVNDTQGNPIVGAEVKFENQENYTGVTDSNGCFRFEDVFELPGKLTIYKYAKTPYINESFDPNNKQNFTLYPVYTIKGIISVKGFSSLNRLIPDLEIKLTQGDKQVLTKKANSNNIFEFTNVYSYGAYHENHTLIIDGIIDGKRKFKPIVFDLKMNESKEDLNIILEVDSTGLIEQESWT